MSVVGNSGSGKSTLARALAAELGVAHIELDAIYHQPGWQPLPAADFRARVDAATATGGWVVDGNYSAVRDLIWARADTVVWLDLPRHAVMRQVIWRTLRRAMLRAELWNGNRERWRNLVRPRPRPIRHRLGLAASHRIPKTICSRHDRSGLAPPNIRANPEPRERASPPRPRQLTPVARQTHASRQIRVSAGVGSQPHACPLSTQTPTSRCRFATAGRRARDRESPPGVGHAAIGTPVALRHRSRLPARQHLRP